MAAMVESLAACLTRQGHCVSIAGMGAEPHVRDAPLGVFVGGLKHRSMIVRGWFEFLGSLRLARRIRLAIGQRQVSAPQLVVTFQPSLFLALTAHLLKRWYGCNVFLVQRDLLPDWLIQSGRLRPGPATWLLGRLKALSLADADKVGIECDENRAFIPGHHQGKVCVLDNWRDYSSANVHDRKLPRNFTLVYGGRIGFAQGFDCFLDGLIAAKLPNILFRIYCDERGAGELRAMQQQLGDQMPELEIHPMLPEARFLATASSCSIGVVSLSPNMGTHNIPGKLLGYLAAGIPIFAIGPRNSALGHVVEDLGIGVYADANDRATIAANLKNVATSREFVERLKSNAIAARPRFAVETAAAEIQSILRA